ncbi:MAG: response regulator transcription factor [Lachnospiraceae bacterium]
MKRILIIEDDTTLAEGLCRALTRSDVQVFSCGTLMEARQKKDYMQEEHFDLILLDVNLPDGNGFDFLKELHEHCSVPVILLTANDMEADMVYGLENGAVDYITKPFSLAVLRARVGVQLRQQDMADGEIGKQGPICIDNFCFDFERMEFKKDNCLIELSKTEQKLLRMFVENRGITLKRSELVDRIWSDGAEYVDENALSVTVKRLRDKLSATEYIKTVYGIGYVWEK